MRKKAGFPPLQRGGRSAEEPQPRRNPGWTTSPCSTGAERPYNRDVTDTEVLADLAAEAGLDRQAFLSAFHSDEARQEAWQDFAIAQRGGVRGFPCLLAGEGEGNRYGLVTSGWQPPGRILPALERWLETVRQPDASTAPERTGKGSG